MKYYIAGTGIRNVTEDEYKVIIGQYAADHDDFWAETEDGKTDYFALDEHMDEIIEDVERLAKLEDGYDMGDGRLYIRPDNCEMYANIEEYKEACKGGLMDEEEIEDLVSRIGKDIHDVSINKHGVVESYIL